MTLRKNARWFTDRSYILSVLYSPSSTYMSLVCPVGTETWTRCSQTSRGLQGYTTPHLVQSDHLSLLLRYTPLISRVTPTVRTVKIWPGGAEAALQLVCSPPMPPLTPSWTLRHIPPLFWNISTQALMMSQLISRSRYTSIRSRWPGVENMRWAIVWSLHRHFQPVTCPDCCAQPSSCTRTPPVCIPFQQIDWGCHIHSPPLCPHAAG